MPVCRVRVPTDAPASSKRLRTAASLPRVAAPQQGPRSGPAHGTPAAAAGIGLLVSEAA